MNEKNTQKLENVNEQLTESDINEYSDKYSENNFWKKIKGTLKSAGLELIYRSLQLYYVTENPNCPMKVKAGIFAALGYFISPFDLIPDITPIVGYSDDAGAIAVALAMAQIYIDDTVRQKAKDKIANIFGDSVVIELDNKV